MVVIAILRVVAPSSVASMPTPVENTLVNVMSMPPTRSDHGRGDAARAGAARRCADLSAGHVEEITAASPRCEMPSGIESKTLPLALIVPPVTFTVDSPLPATVCTPGPAVPVTSFETVTVDVAVPVPEAFATMPYVPETVPAGAIWIWPAMEADASMPKGFVALTLPPPVTEILPPLACSRIPCGGRCHRAEAGHGDVAGARRRCRDAAAAGDRAGPIDQDVRPFEAELIVAAMPEPIDPFALPLPLIVMPPDVPGVRALMPFRNAGGASAAGDEDIAGAGM